VAALRPADRELARNGFGERHAPVFIQSFETGNLRKLDPLTDVRLVQLVDCEGAPFDLRPSATPGPTPIW